MDHQMFNIAMKVYLLIIGIEVTGMVCLLVSQQTYAKCNEGATLLNRNIVIA
jgi:hypothetical protein